MKSFLKMTWMEAKLFLRERPSLFYIALPLIMLFIFGTIYGNKAAPSIPVPADREPSKR
jgi:hypothetical protein